MAELLLGLVLAVALLLGLVFGYVRYVVRAVRKAALSDDGVETLVVPLPTPGHHVALTHHPGKPRRFETPVILCHGLAVNRFNLDLLDDGRGSDRGSLARYLARTGFDVWGLELRGRGRAEVPDGADWTVDDEAREDVPAAIAAVLERTGADRVLWVGHSKGGIVQYLFQASGHPLASRVAGIAAIGSPSTLLFSRRWLTPLIWPGRLLVKLHGKIPLRRWAPLVLPWSRLIHAFGRRLDPVIAANDGPALARILASLPADIAGGVVKQLLSWVEREDGAFVAIDGTVYEPGFSRIEVPLLLVAGERDRLVPPASVRYIADKVSSTDVTYVVMGKNHGFAQDYGHGDLVVGLHAPDEVFPLVARWLESRAVRLEGLVEDHAPPGAEQLLPRTAVAPPQPGT